MMYYASDDYSPNGQSNLNSTTLMGSAICTTFDWVVCASGCEEDLFNDDNNERVRFAKGVAEDGSIVTLVRRNLCNGVSYETVVTNWMSLVFITVVIILLSLYWGAREVRFDEDK